MSARGVAQPLDFTANGTIVIPAEMDIIAFTLNGDSDVQTLDFAAGVPNSTVVAADVSDATGTFGSGTITIEGTNLNWKDLDTATEAAWSTNTNGAYWETITLAGTSSWTASFTNYIDAPFRFIRFRLASATNPRIKGKWLAVKRS